MDLSELTVDELRELAEERGIDLDSGYVRKDDLIEMIGGASERQPEDEEAIKLTAYGRTLEKLEEIEEPAASVRVQRIREANE